MDKNSVFSAIEAGLLVDRRSGRDRRRRRYDLFSRAFSASAGRRRSLRRQADRRSLRLFDYYSQKLFLSVTIVLILSVADALLTLWLIGDGAQELNPVMAYFLTFGPAVFMAVKYLLTSFSVIIVVLLNHISVLRFRFEPGMLLHCFAGCFAAVVAWELFLIARHSI